MKGKDIAITGFALLLVGVLTYLWMSPAGLKQSPQLTITTLDNKPIPLQDFRGQPLLVVFWATTCPGCIEEMPHLVELYEDLHPQGLEIIGIAMAYDPPDQVRTLVSQKRLPYPIALDSEGAAARAFGDVKLTPTSFLIDPKGRIVQQKLGDMDIAQIRTRIIGMLKG